MTTRRKIIDQAFAEIGMGLRVYSLTGDDISTALERLKNIANEWSAEGAASGYSDGEVDGESGAISTAIRGLTCQLAVDLAPIYGRDAMPHTAATARGGKRLLMRSNAVVPSKAVDDSRSPAGAGNDNIWLSADDHEILQGER